MRYHVIAYIPHSSEMIDIVRCSNHDMALGIVADMHDIGADAYIYDNKTKTVKMYYYGE